MRPTPHAVRRSAGAGSIAQERVAVIVGAGTSLGAAIARRYAREGLVACVARCRGEALVPLCQEIEPRGGAARAFPVDARREEEVVSLFERVEAEVGPVEVAVPSSREAHRRTSWISGPGALVEERWCST